MATVTNASDSEREVATMTEPQTQTQMSSSSFNFEPPSSAPRLQAEQALAESVESAESRTIAPLRTTRRHNTRSSSRSVSPSHLTSEITVRAEDPKPKSKGKGRARSTSASSTHQGIEAPNPRGGKRVRAASEQRDDVDEQTPTKRSKVKHTNPAGFQTVSRKRKIKNAFPGSPIPEVPEEEDGGDSRVVKHTRKVQRLPQEELEFSYAHIINTYSPQHPEKSTQPTSHNATTSTPAPAQTESSQRGDAELKPAETAEQRAVHGTSTLTTPQQPVIERTDAQSNGSRSDAAQGIDQRRSLHRYRFESTPPLPTLKNPHPTIRPMATSDDSPIWRQGLLNSRVAQGSARDGGREIPSDATGRAANLTKSYGKPRSRVYHPASKTVLTTSSIPILYDSEREEDIENPWTPEEFKGWKADLKVARSTYERVVAGGRLPQAEPGKEYQIVGSSMKCSQRLPLTTSQTRKPGDISAQASRPRRPISSIHASAPLNAVVLPGNPRTSVEPRILTGDRNIDFVRAAVEWLDKSPENRLPTKQSLIEWLDSGLSKSEAANQARSAAPSPASQQANSQPPSHQSIQRRQTPNSPQAVSSRSDSASPSSTGGEAAIHHTGMTQEPEDHESVALAADDEKSDAMSDITSEVDADEAIPAPPTNPIQTPPRQASEPRAWSSVFSTVKKAVSTPLKFFSFTANAGTTATTNNRETEFTFTHPHKPTEPFTTPSRSSKQRVMPQSERHSTTTTQHRVSPARVPQTERRSRLMDKSAPLFMRGASEEFVQEFVKEQFYDQQASTRQRQRETETANMEQNELSHGKTFRAPSPLSDDDDSDEDIDVDADDEDGIISDRDSPSQHGNKTVLQVPESGTVSEDKVDKNMYVNKPYMLLHTGPKGLTILKPRRVHFEDELSSDSPDEPETFTRPKGPGPYWYPIPDEGLHSLTRTVKCHPEDIEDPYYMRRDPERPYGQYYRLIKGGDESFRKFNLFGEEAYFYRLPPDYKNPVESWTELTHGKERYTRGEYKWRWDAYMEDPNNLKREKALLLKKWNMLSEEQQAECLSKMRAYYRQLMCLGEFAEGESPSMSTSAQPTSLQNTTTPSSNRLLDAHVSFKGAQSVATPTSAANSSGSAGPVTSSETTSNPLLAAHYAFKVAQGQPASSSGVINTNPRGTFRCPSPSDSDSDDEEEDEEEETPKVRPTSYSCHNATSMLTELQTTSDADSALQQKQWDQTPPPKPRPGNAQLPQPQLTPARTALAAALASTNKPRPLLHGPSNLRNVTQMSPLQQADQENRENANENSAKNTTANEPTTKMAPAKETMVNESTTQAPAKGTWVKEYDEAKMTPEEKMRQLKEVHDLLWSIPDEDLPIIQLPKSPKMIIMDGGKPASEEYQNAYRAAMRAAP